MKALLLALFLVLAGLSSGCSSPTGGHTITLTDEEYAVCEKRGDCVLVSKSAIFEAMDNKKKKIEERADSECRNRTNYSINKDWL